MQVKKLGDLGPWPLYLMMNSMVLTSGEVTGLSQDRVSKQDAVAGEHKKQVVDDRLIPQ